MMHMNTNIKNKFEAYEIARIATPAEREEYVEFYQSLARASLTQRNAIRDRIDPVKNAQWKLLDEDFERFAEIATEFEI
jgi:hypothetical protein